MRSPLFFAVLSVAVAACDSGTPPVAVIPAATAGNANVNVAAAPAPAAGPALAAPSMAPPPSAGEMVAGTVLEKIDAKEYSYLKLKTASGEVWTAVTKSDIAVGAPAKVVGAMWMQDFKSTTLNRTFPRIAFGTLEADGPTAPSAPPPAQAGMFAQAAAGAPAAGPGSPKAPPPVGATVIVPRATGKGAHTIAEVFAQKAALKDTVVRIHGKVVKETDHVMNKNWIHLRDGSGKDAAADLTFATDDVSALGDTVVISGTVHLERDLGAGYHYDVLIEDAHIEK